MQNALIKGFSALGRRCPANPASQRVARLHSSPLPTVLPPTCRATPSKRIHPGRYHETHVPTLEDPPRAEPRLPGPNEDRRWPQGAVGTSREGPRPPRRLGPGQPIPTSRSRTANQAARLTGTGAFEAVFRHGSRREGRYVQIITAPASQSTGRVGFVVSAKTLPRAVDRNRLKRLLREFLRASRPDVTAFDLVIRLKRPATREVLADVAREAVALIREVIGNAPATARDGR